MQYIQIFKSIILSQWLFSYVTFSSLNENQTYQQQYSEQIQSNMHKALH